MSREIRVIRVAVGILRRGETILVGQRPASKPYSGYWEFPGGKIEENESAQDALKRELHEELGIHVLSAKPWLTRQHTYPDKTVGLEIWLIEDFSGEPSGKENQLLRWVNLSDMVQLRLLEGNWPIVEEIKRLVMSA